MNWLPLFRPGDWLLSLLALSFCFATFPLVWARGAGEKAIIRRGGEVFAELDLSVISASKSRSDRDHGHWR